MERRKSPYSIQKRPTRRHRHIYYVKFRDESGAYRSAVSSGCTRRDDAIRWAEAHLAETRDRRDHITLAHYATGFWHPEAPFAMDRAAHGRAVSRGYLDIAEGYTRNHLLPVWGELRLRDFTARDLDSWIVALHREMTLAPRRSTSCCRPCARYSTRPCWTAGSPRETRADDPV